MKQTFQNLALLSISLFVFLVIAEVSLRITDNIYLHKYRHYVQEGVIDAKITVGNKIVEPMGYVYAPNSTGYKNSPCSRPGNVSVNAHGYIDEEWPDPTSISERPIAILGDSFMAAREVQSAEKTANLLEKLLNKTVLNTGINGYTPVQEMSTYEQVLRPYKPSVTVMFFFSANDVLGTYCRTYSDTICADIGEDGQVSIQEKSFTFHKQVKPKSLVWAIGEFLGQYLISVHVAYDWMQKFKAYGSEVSPDHPLNIYREQVSGPWPNAWKTVDYVVSRTSEMVRSDGGRFVLVFVPEHLAVTETANKELLTEMGMSAQGLDFDLPNKILEEITNRTGTLYIDLAPVFRNYRDKFNIGFPYFSFWCDGHWNPLGHLIASVETSTRIYQEELLGPMTPVMRSKVDRLRDILDRPPREILGDEAYRQIYDNGVYMGRSNVAEFAATMPTER